METHEKCSKHFFNEKGISKNKGIEFFKCASCGESSANFAGAQDTLCHACARKLKTCNICGRPLWQKDGLILGN